MAAFFLLLTVIAAATAQGCEGAPDFGAFSMVYQADLPAIGPPSYAVNNAGNFGGPTAPIPGRIAYCLELDVRLRVTLFLLFFLFSFPFLSFFFLSLTDGARMNLSSFF